MADGFESYALPVTYEVMEALWASYRKLGPRHETVYRLTRMLGWSIDPAALNRFLAPERPETTHYG